MWGVNEMASYVISDIHGEYDLFCELLDIIDLKDDDILYILGDVVDRGKHPIKVLQKLMTMPNVIPLAGNHELMALESLVFLTREITEENLLEVDQEVLLTLVDWLSNGGETTVEEFKTLSPEEREDVLEYMRDFEIFAEVSTENFDYLLVHAGLGNFYPGKDLLDYTIDDIVWERANYDMQYFDDKYVVTGHTPTQAIEGNPCPGFIYRNKNHIAIDCGACFVGGRLSAICLDTGEEFYSSDKQPDPEDLFYFPEDGAYVDENGQFYFADGEMYGEDIAAQEEFSDISDIAQTAFEPAGSSDAAEEIPVTDAEQAALIEETTETVEVSESAEERPEDTEIAEEKAETPEKSEDTEEKAEAPEKPETAEEMAETSEKPENTEKKADVPEKPANTKKKTGSAPKPETPKKKHQSTKSSGKTVSVSEKPKKPRNSKGGSKSGKKTNTNQ